MILNNPYHIDHLGVSKNGGDADFGILVYEDPIVLGSYKTYKPGSKLLI